VINIEIKMAGISPLLQHNERLADPLDPLVLEIRKFTTKKTKTIEDWENIRHLEWAGGLYVDGNGLVSLPSRCVRACLRNAARFNRLGKDLERSLSFPGMWTDFEYVGPRGIEELYAAGGYVHSAGVVIKNVRNIRFRPIFEKWSLVVTGVLMNDLLSVETLTDIAERAGALEGIGDDRRNGFGRFVSKVSVL
jgi:hypothetical protein